jgi:hypothetical protein
MVGNTGNITFMINKVKKYIAIKERILNIVDENRELLLLLFVVA